MQIVLVEDELSAVPPAVPGPDESADARSETTAARSAAPSSQQAHPRAPHSASGDDSAAAAAAGSSHAGATRGAPKWLKM